MERYTPQIPQEPVEETHTAEKNRELVAKINALHDYQVSRIEQIDKETDAIWDKYKKTLATYTTGGRPNPVDFMSTEDARKFQELKQEESEFAHKINEVTVELLDLLCKDERADWQRLPRSGEPGSLAETHSRAYQAKLDDTYTLTISWFDFPNDSGYIFGPPPEKRESYSASISGSKDTVVKSGIGGFGRKTKRNEFPVNSLGVMQDEKKEFRPEKELLNEFDEPTRAKFQEELIMLGKRLRAQLG